MIEFTQQEQTCLIKGQLTHSEVENLWCNRHNLLGSEIQYIDLSQLTFCDSSGLAFLLSLYLESSQKEQALKLISPSAQMQKLISLYNLQTCIVTP